MVAPLAPLAPGTELELTRKTWRVVSPLAADNSGFGILYAVEDEQGDEAAAKLIDRAAPASEREVLIGVANEAAQHRNVVPVIDYGEYDDAWVLVMRRAEISLKKYLEDRGGSIGVGEALRVLTDVATALEDIDGALVHRDLKPANILLLDGTWSLVDFGISRYADASTETETWKYNATKQYASPEQWRGEHATEAADVYAFGVVGYELLAGHLPFPGPDFRAQHLGEQPPPLTVGPPRLRDLIEECLYKDPRARPTASSILMKLGKITDERPTSAGLEALAQANSREVQRRGAADAQRSAEQERQERTEELRGAANDSFRRVIQSLIDAIRDHASTAQLLIAQERSGRFPIDSPASGKALLAILSGAQLGVDTPQPSPSTPDTLPFTVVSESVITVTRPNAVHGWAGRSHSLWFCNVVEEGRFAWYEHAFMTRALAGSQSTIEPFALDSIDAAAVLRPGLVREQRAWNFDELDRSDPSEFINRWLGWFGRAAQAELERPLGMPEQAIRMDYWWNR